MAIIEEMVVIKSPIEKVFTYVVDANSWPKWQLTMTEAKQTSPGEVGIGTTFAGANKIMGLRMPWTSKFTEYEMNKFFHESIQSKSSNLESTFTFDSMEGSTKVTVVYHLKAGGFLRLISPLLTRSLHKDMKNYLINLKGVLESQS